MGFIIWTLSGMFFIGEGIYCIKSKKSSYWFLDKWEKTLK